MIRRLHVRGWRAFEELDLELGDGVTFVIAENGVGKTSLVEAAAWGLYGDLSDIDARAARRTGSPITAVDLELDLPNGQTLSIARQVDDRSQPMHAMLDNAELTEDEVAGVLAEAFGASREFLSKTTLIPSRAVAEQAIGSFELRSHLSQVFGVNGLESAAEQLRNMHTDAEASAKKMRQAARRAAKDLSELRAALSDVEIAEAQATGALAEARATLDTTEHRLGEAREYERAVVRAAAARRAFAELVGASREVLELDPDTLVKRPADLATLLNQAESAAAETLDDLRREAASVAGTLNALRVAAAQLETAGALCPVCRRELSTEDVAHAADAHAEDMSQLSTREHELAGLIKSASTRLDDVRVLQRQAVRLPELEDVAEGQSRDLAGAAQALAEARTVAEAAMERVAGERARRSTLSTDIADEERVARETQEAFLAHRREAVTAITSQVMQEAAEAILSERIDPLAAEVRNRWKRVFGERGTLQFRPDGQLVLVRGISEIPFTQFSSGEKVVALLATRLLVLGASTRASFVWLDEPLEHLDPPNRRLIASLLTVAGQHVRQILVTTFEEQLVRRLAASGDIHLQYVRSAEP
jgi:DNA repair exonuclease SbcCD ATPase subunit